MQLKADSLQEPRIQPKKDYKTFKFNIVSIQGGAKVVGQCVQLMLIRAQIFLAQNIPRPLV